MKANRRGFIITAIAGGLAPTWPPGCAGSETAIRGEYRILIRNKKHEILHRTPYGGNKYKLSKIQNHSEKPLIYADFYGGRGIRGFEL